MLRLPLTLTTLAIGLVVLGSALPASAAGVGSCMSEKILGSDGLYHEKVELFANTIAMQLRQQGYNVESVQPWGGCVKAFITEPGGGSHMEFFDPDTLQPLGTN